jgi:hypothetical protein
MKNFHLLPDGGLWKVTTDAGEPLGTGICGKLTALKSAIAFASNHGSLKMHRAETREPPGYSEFQARSAEAVAQARRLCVQSEMFVKRARELIERLEASRASCAGEME